MAQLTLTNSGVRPLAPQPPHPTPTPYEMYLLWLEALGNPDPSTVEGRLMAMLVAQFVTGRAN